MKFEKGIKIFSFIEILEMQLIYLDIERRFNSYIRKNFWWTIGHIRNATRKI